MAVCLLSAGFVSCGDDDDEDNIPPQENEQRGDDTSQTTSEAPSYVVAVDLGLSVKWASSNLGASKPEEAGTRFAWGETTEKMLYNLGTYKHADGTNDTYHNIGRDISGTEYDAAHVHWKGTWRMPTAEECYELANKCDFKADKINGIEGYKVTAKGKPNGNYIFIPKYKYYEGEIKYDIIGFWTSTISDATYDGNIYGTKAQIFNYNNTLGPELWWKYRWAGVAIRPVCK